MLFIKRQLVVLIPAVLLGAILGAVAGLTGYPLDRLLWLILLLFGLALLILMLVRQGRRWRPTPGPSPTGDRLRRLALEAGWQDPNFERVNGDSLPILFPKGGRIRYSESLGQTLTDPQLRAMLHYARLPEIDDHRRAVIRGQLLATFLVVAALVAIVWNWVAGALLMLVALAFVRWLHTATVNDRARVESLFHRFLTEGGDPRAYLGANYKVTAIYRKQGQISGGLVNQERLQSEMLGAMAGLTPEELRAIGREAGAPPALLEPQLLDRPHLWLGLFLLALGLLCLYLFLERSALSV